MIGVSANKNIDKYKKDFMGGFSIKETGAIALGLFIGIIVILLLIKVGFPVVLCPYIAVPFIAAPIIPKFYKKDGMGLFEHRKKISEMKKATILSYISTENTKRYEEYLVAENIKKENVSRCLLRRGDKCLE